MSIVDAIILGIIQGVAEFLPISSTGHLVLARTFFGFGDTNGLAFDAVLQLATAFAIFIYFRKDFINLFCDLLAFILRKPGDYTLLKSVIIGTIPAVVLGLLLENQIETVFRSSLLIAVALLFGSMMFYFAERMGKQSQALSIKKGFYIGLFQSLALIPGMSRSGSTLSGGLFNGLNRVDAARFSFLLSFPIICGAGVYKLFDLIKSNAIENLGVPLLVGSLTSFFFGFLSIHYLLKYLKSHTLWLFIWYRVLLAVLILILL